MIRRPLSWLCLVLSVTACDVRPASDPRASMPPQPPDARTTPATPNDALREVEAGVRSVEQLPSFDKASVERLLGASLKHIDAAPSDLPHSEAALSSGPFARVELHE